MKKIYLKSAVLIGLLGIGLFYGYSLYSLQWKCLDFTYSRRAFYGGFVLDLSEAMQRRGYIMKCPTLFPKTKVYFVQTEHPNVWPGVIADKKDLKIALFGDCTENGLDVRYIKHFDVLLMLDEYQNGYLSAFNFRTAHFPLNDKNEKFCLTKYQKHNFDISKLAQRLDDIIQGVRHEKF